MVGQKGSTHFESAEVAAVNHLHNACIDEEDYYTTTSDLSAAAVVRESGACVVLGSGGNREVTIANGGLRKDGSYTRTTPGVYYDEITGNKFTVTQDTISGEVGSTGIAVFIRMIMGREADLADPADQRPVKPVIFIWMLQTVLGLAVIQR